MFGSRVEWARVKIDTHRSLGLLTRHAAPHERASGAVHQLETPARHNRLVLGFRVLTELLCKNSETFSHIRYY